MVPRPVKKDDLPDHMKFGYAVNVEKSAIRDRLIVAGADPKDRRLIFDVEREYQEAHKDDLTFRQRQDLARWRGEKWVTPHPAPPAPKFTNEEIEMIKARFAGSNDPVGQSIYAKALRMTECGNA